MVVAWFALLDVAAPYIFSAGFSSISARGTNQRNIDFLIEQKTHSAADIFLNGNRSMESANICFVLIALALSRITRHLRRLLGRFFELLDLRSHLAAAASKFLMLLSSEISSAASISSRILCAISRFISASSLRFNTGGCPDGDALLLRPCFARERVPVAEDVSSASSAEGILKFAEPPYLLQHSDNKAHTTREMTTRT
jgi:hypothetical protein